MNDVPAGKTWGGYPARPKMQWMRQLAAVTRLTGNKAAAAPTLSDKS
jgi:UDP-3-O-[3-hydroxymyristoyl] glucosamine N-acyltransferase